MFTLDSRAGTRPLLVTSLVGAACAMWPDPREALACSCLVPPAYILPLSGSWNVPRNTRIFVYMQVDWTSTWVHPTGEHIFENITFADMPGAIALVEADGTAVPLEVARADVRPQGPSTWWLAPKALLDPKSRYEVRSTLSGTVLAEFVTTEEVDTKPPHALFGVESVELFYSPGYQQNTLGDCGGGNALSVAFGTGLEEPPYSESAMNGVERLFLRRGDGTYDLTKPLVDVPYAATRDGFVRYLVGWLSRCATGFRIELDECTEWCVRAHPMDLAGNILEVPDERCAVLSSLAPYTPDGPGERMVCPGESGPDDPVGPEAPDRGDAGPDRSCGNCASGGNPTASASLWLLLVCPLAVLSFRRGGSGSALSRSPSTRGHGRTSPPSPATRRRLLPP